MGVAGCGKTVIGSSLASALNWEFVDADSLHPAANVEKMSQGHPLTDEDRWPWLERVAKVIDEWISRGENGVIACSALKQIYRDVLLKQHADKIKFAYLKGSFELFDERLKLRSQHFMKSNMLESQFATLEEPVSALVVVAGLPVPEIVAQLVKQVRS
jgi:carbohydrate kinase (thermoresistant glucokinase family)